MLKIRNGINLRRVHLKYLENIPKELILRKIFLEFWNPLLLICLN